MFSLAIDFFDEFGLERLTEPKKPLNRARRCDLWAAIATGFGPLATNFSLLVASLATAISSYYFLLFSFSFPKIHDGMNGYYNCK